MSNESYRIVAYVFLAASFCANSFAGAGICLTAAILYFFFGSMNNPPE